jgi:hypothetical protein
MRHAKNGLAAISSQAVRLFECDVTYTEPATKSEASPLSGADCAAALYSVDPCGSHHDAVIGIGGELRGGGSILNRGRESHCEKWITTTADLSCCYLIPFGL